MDTKREVRAQHRRRWESELEEMRPGVGGNGVLGDALMGIPSKHQNRTPSHRVSHKKPGKSGQSVIEFCIGLVGILTVIAGVFQLGVLGMGRTQARVQATRIATERSMLSEAAGGVFLPQFVYQMDAGPDGFSYSVDDRTITASPDGPYDRLVRPMAPNQMRVYSPRSEVSQMQDPTDMILAMGLVPGTGRTNGIPILPVVRRLFFNRQSVDIDVRVWSTRTGDIY